MSTKFPTTDVVDRIWARVQLREIMAFGESWLTSVHPKKPLFRTFAADNAIAVECETWVEPSLAWAISYNTWNVHHCMKWTSFMKKNQPMNKWNIWAYYGFEKLAAFGPFCRARPHHRRSSGRVQPGRYSFNFYYVSNIPGSKHFKGSWLSAVMYLKISEPLI